MIVYRDAGRQSCGRPAPRVSAAGCAGLLASALLAGCGLVGAGSTADPGLDPGQGQGPAQQTAPPAAGAPPGAAPDPGALPDFESLGALAAVQVRLVIPAAGVAETLSLTVEEIMAADGQGFRLAACGPFHATSGLLAGVYTVSIVDTGSTGAIARFEVVPTDEVTGPGVYPAVGSVQGTDGQSFPLEGDLTVHSGLLAGEFELRDPAGNPVTGGYTCHTN